MSAPINGFPTIDDETIGCLALFSPYKVCILSCKDLSHTQTQVNCSNNAFKVTSLPLLYLASNSGSVEPLAL